MKNALRPAMALMQRLRLLPKFILVCLVFLVPLLLVTALLMTELNKSLAFAEKERQGVAFIAQSHEVSHLLQQRRALEHLRLNGKQDIDTAALRDAIEAKIGALGALRASMPEVAPQAHWDPVAKDWQALREHTGALKARDSFSRHSALIAHLGKLSLRVAENSKLSLDPEAQTNYLIDALLKTLPDVTERLSDLSGRGAAFIDTGLFEANEDQRVNAAAMIARNELERAPAQFDDIVHGNPALLAGLQEPLKALPAALAFLDRVKDEVSNSYNQTSGKEFNAAGSASVDGLYRLMATSAQLVDQLLAERSAQATLHRNLILAAVLAAVAAAAYLFAGFYASFSRDVGHLQVAVRDAAAGDLSARIESRAQDEIGDLVNAFGGMTRALATLVAEIRNRAATIAATTDDMASGNETLSSHTASQAGALQDTVGSMRQLTATVHGNARHAQDGQALVLSATEVARRGGQTVGAVVATMASIKASSNKVVDIIGVIDGIAFQTNILALNAAVEAARAGEQGRGFAVVAAEVRTLAQRSAAAAQEIKGLIGASVGEIDAGDALVGAAGQTMQQIVASVQQVAGIIEHMGAAGASQSVEIEQVNRALTQINEMTQQNGDLVRDAAVGSGQLRDESRQLTEAVSRFTLDPSTAAVATAAPASPAPVRPPLLRSANKPSVVSRRKQPLQA